MPPKPVEITVPRLGWSMEQGTFIGWLKQNGDPVEAGEPLFTLESDKASQDVDAIDSGVLHIPVGSPPAGTSVTVGTILGFLLPTSTDSDLVPPTLPPTPAPSPSLSPPDAQATESTLPSLLVPPTSIGSPTPPSPGRLLITPRARNRALALRIDPRAVRGTGRSGRIRERDILAATIDDSGLPRANPRLAIARLTARSAATIPHFHLRAEVDATELLSLKHTLSAQSSQPADIKLSITDFLIRAQAIALAACPFANAVWDETAPRALADINVGLVVALPDGLLIPTLRSPHRGPVTELAKQRSRVVDAARRGTLLGDATNPATTLSNLGQSPVDEFTALIPPGQSSILAVGRAVSRPWVVGGALAVRVTLKLCLSIDHRVMDAKPAADFFGRVLDALERPRTLL